ncbi:hypothetical protein AAHC03_020969 [Spirometra sp. Aus1]
MGQTANKPVAETAHSEGTGPSLPDAKLPSSATELASPAPTESVLTPETALPSTQPVAISPVRHQFRRAMGSQELLHADEKAGEKAGTTVYAVRPPRAPSAISPLQPDNSPQALRARRCISTTSDCRHSATLPLSPRERNASGSILTARYFSYIQHQHQQRYPAVVQNRRRFVSASGAGGQQSQWRPSSLSLTRINDDSQFLPLREVAAANTVSVPDLTKMPLRSAMKGSRNHSSLSLNQAGNSAPQDSVRLPMSSSVSAHNLSLSPNENSPKQISEVSKITSGSGGADRNNGSRRRFRDFFPASFSSTSPKSKESTHSGDLFVRERSNTRDTEANRESLFFPNVPGSEDSGDAGDDGRGEKLPSKKTSHRHSELTTGAESLKPIFEVESTPDSPDSLTPPTDSPAESWQLPRLPLLAGPAGGRKVIISEGSEESIDEVQSASSSDITGSPHTSSENDGHSDLCPQQLMIRGTVTSVGGQAVLRFYECVSVHEVDSDFPRAAERTWMTLTPLDKALIRRELNEYKRGEMEVHPESFGNTRFHPG